jgi:SNF2 family DNA or RNA helicase
VKMGIVKKGNKVVRTHITSSSRIRPKTFDYKKLSLEDLRDLFQDVRNEVFGDKEPRKHQYASLGFATEKDRIGYIHDIGTGKTFCAIWTSHIWQVKRTLVVGPTDSFAAWERDLRCTQFKYVFLSGKAEDRKKLLNQNYDFYIINYEGLKVLFAEILYTCPYCFKRFGYKEEVFAHFPNCEKYQSALYQEKPVKGEWTIDYDLFSNKFDCLVFDELHRASNDKSLQGKIAFELSWRAKKVIGMTGSPCRERTQDEDLLQLWYMMKVLDLGASLGNNFFKYRKRFFYEAGFKWKLKKGCRDKILDLVSSSCIRYERSECMDLPPVIYELLSVEPSSEQLKMEDKLIKDYASDPLQLDQKLKQLASGFVYQVSDSGRRATERFACLKIKELEYALEVLDKEKVIIFFNYIEEGNMLQEFLTNEKISYTTIIGKDSIKQRDENFKNFTSSKKISVLLAQCRCASESREMIVCHTAIFICQTDHRTRMQCEGRIVRDGQKHSCLIVDIIVKGSIEEKVIQNRDSQKDSAEIILEFIKEKGGVA